MLQILLIYSSPQVCSNAQIVIAVSTKYTKLNLRFLHIDLSKRRESRTNGDYTPSNLPKPSLWNKSITVFKNESNAVAQSTSVRIKYMDDGITGNTSTEV